MNAKEKKDLLVSKIALLVIAVMAIVVTIWIAWARPGDSSQQVNSFAECVAAGYPLLESYPEVCMADDGRRFTNPDQVVQ